MIAKKIWESISDDANCWENLSSEERETLELVAGIAYMLGRGECDLTSEKIMDIIGGKQVSEDERRSNLDRGLLSIGVPLSPAESH